MSSIAQQELFSHETEGGTDWFSDFCESLNVSLSPGWPDEFGRKVKNWLDIQDDFVSIKTLSLFSGGGGLDIGFHDIGFDIVECVEIDPRFTKTLTENSSDGLRFSGTKINCVDIREYEPAPNLEVDFVIGGPPCQTFSAAGARAAGVQGLDDRRGTLFEEYVRLLKKLKPRGFLFENVYRIVGAQSGKPWALIQDAFQNAGYKIFWRILDTADFGVPQHRERLFIVGIKDGSYEFPRPTHGPDAGDKKDYYDAGTSLRGISRIDSSAQDIGLGGRHGHLLRDIPPGLNYSFYTKKMGYPKPIFAWRSKFSDYLYKADPEMPVRTIKAQGGQYTGPFSWESRPFTVSELKKLQTFPDDYKILGNRQTSIMQLGNSVPPQIARILALSILNQVFDVELPSQLEYMPKGMSLSFRARKRVLTDRYQKKARLAIDELERKGRFTNSAKSVVSKKKGTAYLTGNLDLNETNQGAIFALEYDLDLGPDIWRFGCRKKGTKSARPAYSILIELNANQSEVLTTRKVLITCFSADKRSLPASWKLFEQVMKSHTGKDDLVQLFGYYQYTGTNRISVDLINRSLARDDFWRVIRIVAAGRVIGKVMPVQDLAQILEISQTDCLKILRMLKENGFEIRNSKTNSQLKDDDYLIPYAFPSLTSRSLQLLTEL